MGKKTTKVAIILAGGVSLGSYEAGVMTEILYTLGDLNNRLLDRRYVLDVLTGSSAGALTAALTARITMCEAENYRRNLYSAWVEDIDITGLMRNPPKNAVLSKKIIDEIASRYISMPANSSNEKANFAPETMYLCLTHTNMRGIDYSIKYKNSNDCFMTTMFSDSTDFEINSGTINRHHYWEKLKECAIASGNFPIAFRPHMLKRDLPDYKGYDPIANGLLPNEIAFIDGGLFNNEPMKDAIRLARKADGGHLSSERIFILIDPNLNTSGVKNISPDIPIDKQLYRLCQMVYGESTAKDWLKTQRTSNNIRWRDSFVENFSMLLQNCEIRDQQKILNDLTATSGEIFALKNHLFPGQYEEDKLKATVVENTWHYSNLRNALPSEGTDLRQQIFDQVVFILDNISGLRNKTIIEPWLISCSSDEVAGDQMFAFGGFFERKWREYDFKAGRIKASKLMPLIFNNQNYRPEEADGTLPHPDYQHSDEGIDPKKAQMKDAEKKTREEFSKLLISRIENDVKSLLEAQKISWVQKIAVRGATSIAINFFLKPLVNGEHWLQLKK